GRVLTAPAARGPPGPLAPALQPIPQPDRHAAATRLPPLHARRGLIAVHHRSAQNPGRAERPGAPSREPPLQRDRSPRPDPGARTYVHLLADEAGPGRVEGHSAGVDM